jgi:heterodisulfide reductase subunit A-like polyferredoxin
MVPVGTDPGRVMLLEDLEATVQSLPRITRERVVVIVLDLINDESKSSTAAACKAALAMQKRGAIQVHLLCRHARVATPEISALYDATRESGVAFLKYDGRPAVSRSDGPAVLQVACMDPVLHAPVTIECDFIAFSRDGLARELPEVFVNNLHFSPTHSSVPGYYLAGPATGEHYPPLATAEAVEAAVEAGRLLSPGTLHVELSTATVDEDKCAICLTCIRVCPHQAMTIDGEKNIAENLPQACQRCGICVGVCPARAISLPGYSEDVVLAFLD